MRDRLTGIRVHPAKDACSAQLTDFIKIDRKALVALGEGLRKLGHDLLQLLIGRNNAALRMDQHRVIAALQIHDLPEGDGHQRPVDSQRHRAFLHPGAEELLQIDLQQRLVHRLGKEAAQVAFFKKIC